MKYLPRSLSTFTLVLAACGFSVASLQADPPASPPLPPPPPPPPPLYYPFDVGIEAGVTTGAGAFGDWRFADHFGVRGGADYLPFDRSGKISDVDYTGKLRLLSEPLTFDLYPSKASSFHVCLGVALNENQLTGTGTGAPGATVNLNGMTFPYSEVGTLNIRIKQRVVDPYLSIRGNFFYFDQAHHWGFGGELGAMYTGSPQVSLTRSGGTPNATVDNALAAEQQKANHYARDFQFWPIIKLQVNYAF